MDALTLANLTLPANYVWNAPTTTLDVSKSGQTFPATYTDPSGNYNAASGNITVNVAKADYNMAGISFNDAVFTHDGSPHSIAIIGTLPTGVTVTYTGNGQTAAGTYTVTATFAVANTATHNVPPAMTAALVINEATPIFSNRTNPIGSIVVQTASNAILLSNLPPNARVDVYSLQGKRVYSAYPGNPSILKIGVQTNGIYVVKAGSQSVRVVVR